MRQKPEIIISLLFILIFQVSGKGQCKVEETAFKAGEKLTYEVSYNWSFVWVSAGKVIFETDTITVNNTRFFDFKGIGKSYSFYDWFYKVRDNFSSIADKKTLLPVESHRNTSDGNYKVNNSYLFDYDKNRVISSIQNSKNPLTIDTLDLEPCTFDLLSAVYYTRTLNFSDKTPGYEVPVRFTIDGEFYEIVVKYLGKEKTKDRNGKQYNCIKFSADLVAGTIFKEGKKILVWVTNDRNKIPIMVEASIMVGSVKAYLSAYQGLKYELSSQIK